MRSNTGQILYIPRVGQRANLQHPLMRGCVGWWPLTDGGGGIAKDISTGANDLIGSGGYGWSNQSLGVVASSDGVDGAFRGGAFSSITDLTVSFWVYYDGSNNISDFVSNRVLGLNGTTHGFTFGSYGSTSEVIFAVDSASGNYETLQSLKTTSLPTNTWINFCGTWEQSTGTLKVYKDGVDVTSSWTSYSSGTVGTINSTSNMTIANRPGTTVRSLGGYIQNVRVWNRALSSSEVLELYTNPWSGLSMPSATRYFFVSQPQQIFPPRMKLKTSINLGKGGRIVI